MKLDQAIAVVVFLVGAGYLWLALHLKPPIMQQAVGPKAFPIGIAVALMVSAVWLLIESTRSKAPPVDLEPRDPDYRSMGITFVALLAYSLLLNTLGFLVTTVLFLIATISALETQRRHWPRTVVVSLVSGAVIFWVFNDLLGVRLPGGPFM